MIIRHFIFMPYYFMNLIIPLFITHQLVNGDCGVAGVPAFGRIISADYSPTATSFPEGFTIKYDCLHYGYNINGEENRICHNSQWTPWQIPICGIIDPDDGKSPFLIDIRDTNNSTQNGTFLNDYQMFDNLDTYTNKTTSATNFVFSALNDSYLWRIHFAQQYPVEYDHSFLVAMQFVVHSSKSFNYSHIGLDVESRFTSTARTCHHKIETDSVDTLFQIKPINYTDKDVYYKIIMECRNDWQSMSNRWAKPSPLETFNSLNISLIVRSETRIDLILTQLTIDADCGYPDIPLSVNYSRSWMNAIYSCVDGELNGPRNVSCKYDGRWSAGAPKCCRGDECLELSSSFTVSKVVLIVIIVAVIIILLAAVIGLAIAVFAMFVKLKKRQAKLEVADKNIEHYDDIDLNDNRYESIPNQDYSALNYDYIDKRQLDVYDNVIDGRYKTRMSMIDIKNADGDYVKMDYMGDEYLDMSKPAVESALKAKQYSKV